MDGKGGVGFKFFVKDEGHFGIGDGRDLGAVEEAVRYDVKDLAGLGAQDAGEVGRLLAGEGGMGGVAGLGRPSVGDPAAACHKGSCKLQVTGCQIEKRGRQGLGMVTVKVP